MLVNYVSNTTYKYHIYIFWTELLLVIMVKRIGSGFCATCSPLQLHSVYASRMRTYILSLNTHKRIFVANGEFERCGWIQARTFPTLEVEEEEEVAMVTAMRQRGKFKHTRDVSTVWRIGFFTWLGTRKVSGYSYYTGSDENIVTHVVFSPISCQFSCVCGSTLNIFFSFKTT